MLESLMLLPMVIATFSPHNLEAAHALETSQHIVDASDTVILDVPFVHQIDNLSEQAKQENGGSACGPTTLTMLLKDEGLETNLDDVIEKLPNNVYIKGVMFYDLAAGPTSFGKEAVEVEQSPKGYFETLKKGKPIALNVQNYDGITGHAVVIVGIRGFDGKSAKSLIIHDPLKGPYQEFKYISDSVLEQPAGYHLPIGIIEPFYIK